MDRFDVELLAFEGDPPIDAFADAFGIDRERARRIALRAPAIVKRDVDERTARRYAGALRALGAHVALHRSVAPALAPPWRDEVEASAIPALAVELDEASSGAGAVPYGGREVDVPALPDVALELDGASSGAGAVPYGGREVDVPALPDTALELDVAAYGAGGLLPVPELDGDPAAATPVVAGDAGPSPALPQGERIGSGESSTAAIAASAPVVRERAPVERELDDRGSYGAAVVKAYLYPFQKSALPALVGVPLALQLVSYLPWLASFFLGGAIWISYLFAVTRHASAGRSDLPLAPDAEPGLEVLKPLVRYMLALLVPGALLAALFFGLTAGAATLEQLARSPGALVSAGVPILFVLVVGLWLVYLPASLILAAHSQGWLGGLNLIAGVQLIAREPRGYATMLAGLAPAAVVMVVASAAAELVDARIPIPFLPGFVGQVISFVPALIGARILGLYLWHYEHELGIA